MTALLLAAGCSAPPQAEDSPAAARSTAPRTVETAAADRSLSVAAAPEGTPAATATPDASGSGDAPVARRSTLKVASYDSRTGRAVIAPTKGGASAQGEDDDGAGGEEPGKTEGTGTATPQPSTAPAEPHRTAVGDVIASAPAPGAPDGLLARITKVVAETDRGTEVETEPATLDSVLGDDSADGSVPVDPASFEVDELLPDVDVSWTTTGDVRVGPESATVPLGSLRLDVRAELPAVKSGPASAKASVSGFVQVAPQVDFRYGGTGTDSAPDSAYLGVSGDWTSGWALKGRAAATQAPLRIPFAELHSDPVLQVGPVPVVVNLDLTCYLEISGDGTVSVDLEQNVNGEFEAGGTFSPSRGWTPASSADMTGTPVKTSVTAAGKVRATVGAEAGVGLYGSVGVLADLAPYVRAEATADASGTPVTWGVYGGLDLKGTLRLQLSVFGTPVLRHDVPLGALHREWKLAGSGTT
ncbi:hypothetical protein AB0D49_02040 [Streptomyces sp. NPDC048290]|uniref:hypothetical protein n=1 Tax=Streptomyces sp. NPDC048290 TaxID=3155811 RepID=UPI00342B122E